VRDLARFDGGWAFFSFEGESTATQIPVAADCYGCHAQHGAVDTTFVQFYPTLLEVATAKRTLSAAYLREERETKFRP
jgi:aspartate oxidase